jgi:structural hemagglutinin/hemolysin toxin protein RtxA
MYSIIFYVPESHLERVKTAMFSVGAGKIGHYDHCAWQCLGQGQFRPLAQSHAFIGNVDQIEKIAEYRVELVCEKALIKLVIEALIATHPFETPAYSVLEMKTLADF